MLGPNLAALLLAIALGGALSLQRLRKVLRGAERFCESCGRSIILGERTCDCDLLKTGCRSQRIGESSTSRSA
jgi:hypothetical protein